MKKVVSSLLVAVMVLSFAACGEVTADTISDKLQGVWESNDGRSTLTFDDYEVSMTLDGKYVSGSYSIDMEESIIILTLNTTPNSSTFGVPFQYEGGKVTLKNSSGVEVYVKK